MSKELIDYLSNFISDNRRSKFEEVIKWRTRHITVVLEDIYQPHNASAVLRSCDCFGIQDIHVIENKNKYNINPDVALGSPKWLNLIKYNQAENNTLECIKALKSKGYRIIATTPHERDCNIEDLPVDGKLALVFGTELEGISNTIREMADEYVKIPMYGFTESFNISVSAAICLHTSVMKLHASNMDWRLTEEERNEVLLGWLRNSINRSALLEKEFYSKQQEL
jgi:tRNA (guanosine-2'-O-)-methyltransferase